MASDYEWPEATIMEPSAIFPILLSLVINELHFSHFKHASFLTGIGRKIYLQIKYGCSTWARLCDTNMVAIFGEKLFRKFSDLTTNC